ncbi:MAG: isoprenyl transferase [Vulcanimicrobiaceae bacterium]
MLSRKALHASAEPLPRHLAIVIDGNRRWAQARKLTSADGHRAGATALRATVRTAERLGLECLTIFAFPEEHWGREEREVAEVMDLVRSFATADAEALVARDVRVRVLGRTERLPAATREAVEALVTATARGGGMALNLALDYGARTELCHAIRALALDVARGTLAAGAIDDDSIGAYLYTAGLPDPDLVIRTGGGLRVANFLLYQIAYAELWATPTPWPDFDETLLRRALGEFASRQRRFGS